MTDYDQGMISARKSFTSIFGYTGFLCGAKLLKVFGLYLSYDVLKLVHMVQFLCVTQAVSSVPFLLLQKPFTSGRRITRNQWFKITRLALLNSFVLLLWFFGLTLCGPLRTVLLYEHSEIALIAAVGAVCSSPGSGPSKFRGALLLLTGVVCLLLFDHDEATTLLPYEPESHKHSSVLTHTFYHIVNLLGWSDHKGGVVLLCVTVFLSWGCNNHAKKLSVDIGGSKRLHALVSFMSFLLLVPWAIFVTFTTSITAESLSYLIVPFVILAVCIFVIDFYTSAIVVNHLKPHNLAKLSTLISYMAALVLSLFWSYSIIASGDGTAIREEHVLSGGVIFSWLVFSLATHILTNAGKASRGSFIGYSPGGMPLYTYTSHALQSTSQSASSFVRHTISRILEESDSRRIFYFLLINLAFTFVELIYGVITNSLGLISDGFHMMFDCSALVMGLVASVMSRWKPTRVFSFGYDRVEVLSGFINGLFLVVIAFFVFSNALSRLVHPQEVKTEKLLTVSVMGLCVNLIGIFAFHGAHGHSHGLSHSHGPVHSHSHGPVHSHSHSDNSSCASPRPHNTNMEGVFLHVLADTLGSVGVIISSILIEHFGWLTADALCSIFIAALIFMSVIPLLRETSIFLLLGTPSSTGDNLRTTLNKVVHMDGVLSYRDCHVWHQTAGRTLCTLHLQVTEDVQEQKIISQVSAMFKEVGLKDVVMQVEKESYFQHLQGLGSNQPRAVLSSSDKRTLNKSHLSSIKSV